MEKLLNVLIVEDSPEDAELLVSELERAGYPVKWKRVDSEPEYRGQLSDELDIIFSDFSLPQLSTPRALKILMDSGLEVPFIIVSGTIGEERAVECVRMGAADYLLKDRLARLGTAVNRALEERRLRREKQATEMVLIETQKRLTHVMSASPAVAYLFEVRGNMHIPVWVSQNVHSFCGFQPLEVLAQDWWLDHLHPDDRERVMTEMAAMRLRERLVQEYRLRRRDGVHMWVRDEKRLLSDASGRPTEIVGSWSDITERKDLETQLWQSQKLELLGQLAGGVAHDFNNILAVIQGHASLLQASGALTTKDATDSAEQICLAAERAAALSRQLLTFSRKQVLQSQQVDLNQVIHDLTKMLQRVVGADVTLEVKAEEGLPMISADITMMEQVLMNLVVNARDAMPRGGRLIIATSPVFVDASLRELNPGMQPGNYVCLSVTDTGCGIPPENLSRIFEPFFTTKEAGKGTGLGLATVYGIVHQHGGWIKVYSELDRGTVFRMYLPAVATDDTKVIRARGKVDLRGGAETILLAEDEASLRALTHNILERYGYHVLEAETASAAMEQWRKNDGMVDLLLTDVVMPGGVSGKQLAEQLHKECPSLKVIYSSAYSADVVGKDFGLVEGSNFLQKPYGVEKLLQTVRNCLDKHHSN